MLTKNDLPNDARGSWFAETLGAASDKITALLKARHADEYQQLERRENLKVHVREKLRTLPERVQAAQVMLTMCEKKLAQADANFALTIYSAAKGSGGNLEVPAGQVLPYFLLQQCAPEILILARDELAQAQKDLAAFTRENAELIEEVEREDAEQVAAYRAQIAAEQIAARVGRDEREAAARAEIAEKQAAKERQPNIGV